MPGFKGNLEKALLAVWGELVVPTLLPHAPQSSAVCTQSARDTNKTGGFR